MTDSKIKTTTAVIASSRFQGVLLHPGAPLAGTDSMSKGTPQEMDPPSRP